MNLQRALILFSGLCAVGFPLIMVNVDACRDSEAIGRIIAIKGAITVNKMQTRLNAPLCFGDVVHTGSGSRAALKLLGSNTVFRIEEQAELRLLGSLGDRRFSVDPSKQPPLHL